MGSEAEDVGRFERQRRGVRGGEGSWWWGTHPPWQLPLVHGRSRSPRQGQVMASAVTPEGEGNPWVCKILQNSQTNSSLTSAPDFELSSSSGCGQLPLQFLCFPPNEVCRTFSLQDRVWNASTGASSAKPAEGAVGASTLEFSPPGLPASWLASLLPPLLLPLTPFRIPDSAPGSQDVVRTQP